jgi:hypothetical protein
MESVKLTEYVIRLYNFMIHFGEKFFSKFGSTDL